MFRQAGKPESTEHVYRVHNRIVRIKQRTGSAQFGTNTHSRLHLCARLHRDPLLLATGGFDGSTLPIVDLDTRCNGKFLNKIRIEPQTFNQQFTERRRTFHLAARRQHSRARAACLATHPARVS